MGAVHEVEHIETGRRAALKVMLPHVLGGEGARDQFKSEARVAARLRSEHVVDVLDAGVDSATGMPFLVMELLEGEDLSARLRRLGPLPPEDVVAYLSQVARALDRVHRAGIVHRDLKPENLFLTEREDGSPLVKVLDFGIAKILGAGATSALTFEARGTPIYMSPEQFTHEMKISPATDIYALGMVAFTLLAGSAYWAPEIAQGMNVFLIARLAEGGPQEAASARARRSSVELPARFDKWFAKATAIEPKTRFSSALEAVRALAEALDVVVPPRTERERPSFVGPESRPGGVLSAPPSGRNFTPLSGRGSPPPSGRNFTPLSGRGSPPPSGRGSGPGESRASAPESAKRNSPYPELLARGSSPDLDRGAPADRMALSPGALHAADVGLAPVLRRTLPRGARSLGDVTPSGDARSDSAPREADAPAGRLPSAAAEDRTSLSPSEPSLSAARTGDPAEDKGTPAHEGATTGGGTTKTAGVRYPHREGAGKRATLWLALAAVTIGVVGMLRMRPRETPAADSSSVSSEEPSLVSAAPKASAETSPSIVVAPSPSVLVAPSPTGPIEAPADSASPSAKAAAAESAKRPSVPVAPTGKAVRTPATAPTSSAKRSLYTQD